MAKRPTRLRFTEDDLSSDAVKKAAGKAEKAAAKAEKAVDKSLQRNTASCGRKLMFPLAELQNFVLARQRQMIFPQSLPVSNER